MSAEKIAKELDRNPDSVAMYIKKHYNIGVTQVESAEYTLVDRPFYSEIKSQFTNGEMELFKYHWGRIVLQFNRDVLPTEEMQIVDVIKLEMLMNRCLKSNKDNIQAVDRISDRLERLITSANPEDMEEALNLERQLGALRASQESLNRDYRDLQTKKSAMLKDMKGTREQRIKRLEDSKESFPAWIASLMQNPDKLRDLGKEMEMMRLATEKEKARLSDFHKFADNSIDQPYLTAETVMK